jgi:hypothetical protein
MRRASGGTVVVYVRVLIVIEILLTLRKWNCSHVPRNKKNVPARGHVLVSKVRAPSSPPATANAKHVPYPPGSCTRQHTR